MSSSASTLNLVNFGEKGGAYPFALSLAGNDHRDVGPTNTEVPRDPGHQAAVQKHPPKFGPGRVNIRTGSFVTHTTTVVRPQSYPVKGKVPWTGGVPILDKGQSARPEWCERVLSLRRDQLRLTQKQFADLLGLTISSVSNWETGAKEPSAEHFVKMANLADPSERLWFWRHIGIDLATVPSAAAALRQPHQPKRKTG